MKIYLIGSLRNPEVPKLANIIRDRCDVNVFDDWYSAGERADDHLMEYEKQRGHSYAEALNGHSVRHVFEFDKMHLDDSDAGILLLPAGKSCHLELGYLRGQGKPVWILMPNGEPERWDIMYRFATELVYTVDDLILAITGEWK